MPLGEWSRRWDSNPLGAMLLEVSAVSDDPTAGLELSPLAFRLTLWSAEEEVWIRENPPSRCYQSVWTLYSEAVSLVALAADDLGDALQDATAVARFESVIRQADDVIGEAVTARGQADCG